MSAANQSAASNISVPRSKGSNTSTELTLAASAILYTNDQSANLDLWDSIFALISLLGINKFQSYDAQNIICSYVDRDIYLAMFLDDKLIKDLSNLVEVSVAVWHLINTIYVLWNTLDTDNFPFLLFNFLDFILILLSFLFLIFFWMMKRHVILQSHDISHDVTS